MRGSKAKALRREAAELKGAGLTPAEQRRVKKTGDPSQWEVPHVRDNAPKGAPRRAVRDMMRKAERNTRKMITGRRGLSKAVQIARGVR